MEIGFCYEMWQLDAVFTVFFESAGAAQAVSTVAVSC
jgi:hypothetical protein